MEGGVKILFLLSSVICMLAAFPVTTLPSPSLGSVGVHVRGEEAEGGTGGGLETGGVPEASQSVESASPENPRPLREPPSQSDLRRPALSQSLPGGGKGGEGVEGLETSVLGSASGRWMDEGGGEPASLSLFDPQSFQPLPPLLPQAPGNRVMNINFLCDKGSCQCGNKVAVCGSLAQYMDVSFVGTLDTNFLMVFEPLPLGIRQCNLFPVVSHIILKSCIKGTSVRWIKDCPQKPNVVCTGKSGPPPAWWPPLLTTQAPSTTTPSASTTTPSSEQRTLTTSNQNQDATSLPLPTMSGPSPPDWSMRRRPTLLSSPTSSLSPRKSWSVKGFPSPSALATPSSPAWSAPSSNPPSAWTPSSSPSTTSTSSSTPSSTSASSSTPSSIWTTSSTPSSTTLSTKETVGGTPWQTVMVTWKDPSLAHQTWAVSSKRPQTHQARTTQTSATPSTSPTTRQSSSSHTSSWVASSSPAPVSSTTRSASSTTTSPPDQSSERGNKSAVSCRISLTVKKKTSPPTLCQCPQLQSSSGLGTGEIVGIVFGSIAVIAILLFLTRYFWRRRMWNQAQRAHAQPIGIPLQILNDGGGQIQRTRSAPNLSHQRQRHLSQILGLQTHQPPPPPAPPMPQPGQQNLAHVLGLQSQNPPLPPAPLPQVNAKPVNLPKMLGIQSQVPPLSPPPNYPPPPLPKRNLKHVLGLQNGNGGGQRQAQPLGLPPIPLPPPPNQGGGGHVVPAGAQGGAPGNGGAGVGGAGGQNGGQAGGSGTQRGRTPGIPGAAAQRAAQRQSLLPILPSNPFLPSNVQRIPDRAVTRSQARSPNVAARSPSSGRKKKK